MKQKFKSLSRITRMAIIAALFLSITIVAYAAISMLISITWRSDLTKGDIFEMELVQSDITGEIVPGQSISVSPVVKNMGTKEAIAFVKVEMPTIPSSGANAYTFVVDESMWTKVEESSGTVVYGYNDVLGVDGQTDALCQSMIMVEMSGTDFMGLSDVNVSITGYLADRETYGEDVQMVWNEISGE